MDSTLTTNDWLNEPAHDEASATRKYRWWCQNHGSQYAYAAVSIREQALMPTAVRVAMINEFKHVAASAPTSSDINSQAAAWLDVNAYKEVTTRSLGDALGVSPAVARRLIRDLPHYFKRINQYKHEVRNYREERQLDKSQQ
jgi:hypothetical protein